MTSEQLTAILAEQVMGWGVCPDRFLTGNRGWIRRGRFQPLVRIDDAFKLVGMSGATLLLTIAADGRCSVEVHLAQAIGKASRDSVAECITLAISRAIGLDPEGDK